MSDNLCLIIEENILTLRSPNKNLQRKQRYRTSNLLEDDEHSTYVTTSALMKQENGDWFRANPPIDFLAYHTGIRSGNYSERVPYAFLVKITAHSDYDLIINPKCSNEINFQFYTGDGIYNAEEHIKIQSGETREVIFSLSGSQELHHARSAHIRRLGADIFFADMNMRLDTHQRGRHSFKPEWWRQYGYTHNQVFSIFPKFLMKVNKSIANNNTDHNKENISGVVGVISWQSISYINL